MSRILSGGEGCIPACLARSHDQHYISSCIVVQPQLEQGQHTGNIKCMMGWMGHMVHWADTPWRDTPFPGETPTMQTPLTWILRDTVNEQAVRILVECILVTARKRSLGQGNIFTSICHSVHRGACVACSPRDAHPPGHAYPPVGYYEMLPPANEVWGKVIFSQASVILFTGGMRGMLPLGTHTPLGMHTPRVDTTRCGQ